MVFVDWSPWTCDTSGFFPRRSSRFKCRQIEYDEFVKWWGLSDRFKALKLSEEALALRAKAAEIFGKCDTDKNGSIDRKEFSQLYKSLVAAGLTTKSEQSCLEDLDTSRDGNIQFNEYINWLQRPGMTRP